jgi:hypothetical protein
LLTVGKGFAANIFRHCANRTSARAGKEAFMVHGHGSARDGAADARLHPDEALGRDLSLTVAALMIDVVVSLDTAMRETQAHPSGETEFRPAVNWLRAYG